jgi:hypothetical protein
MQCATGLFVVQWLKPGATLGTNESESCCVFVFCFFSSLFDVLIIF